MTTTAIVATMAAVLATTEKLALVNEGDCILTLHQARYTAKEILHHLDAARREAFRMRAVMLEDAAARVEQWP